MASPVTRLGAVAAAAVSCGVGAWLGAWWVPFVAGVGASLLAGSGPRPRRGCVLPAAAGAACGWLVVLWLVTLRGLPVGATARAVGALAGLPPYAGVALAVTLLLAALQVMAGAWLARAVMSLSAGGRGGPLKPDGPRPGPDPQRGASGDPHPRT